MGDPAHEHSNPCGIPQSLRNQQACVVTGTWLRGLLHQPTPTGCCLLHEPSSCALIPGEPHSGRRLPGHYGAAGAPRDTLTGKAVSEINSGLAAPARTRQIEGQNPLGLSSPAATTPWTADRPPLRPVLLRDCYLQGPHLHLPLPSEAQAPYHRTRIRRNFWLWASSPV